VLKPTPRPIAFAASPLRTHSGAQGTHFAECPVLCHPPCTSAPILGAGVVGGRRRRNGPSTLRDRCGGWYPRSFVLTDIVGSVSLWERDPDRMAQAVARHYAIIGREVVAFEGELVRSKGEGDSTFSVFVHPAKAVAAALAMQAAVRAEQWPTTAHVRMRVGVHTGDAEPRNGDWYGPAVNRAARLRALAGGNQTLLTGVTAALVGDRLPAASQLLYRGRRMLRGIERPEEVRELVGVDDPRLPGAGSPRVRSLPPALTRFVGRSDDVERLVELVQRERLVTLTGAGGSGKTRLALEVARDVTRGGEVVWLAELAPLREGGLVAQTVATAVGADDGPEPLDRLLARTERLDGVLVLDNCEHLLDACTTLIDRLLGAAPGLRVLATSREALGLDGEQLWPVRPLDVPDDARRDPEELARVESVQLLMDRARSVRQTRLRSTKNSTIRGSSPECSSNSRSRRPRWETAPRHSRPRPNRHALMSRSAGCQAGRAGSP
jgi:class 3 adenylate cyclase